MRSCVKHQFWFKLSKYTLLNVLLYWKLLKGLYVGERTLQFLKMNMDCILNKPYVNGVILRGQNLSLKCFESLDQTICQQRRLRSFKRGTVSLYRSKGCKVVACQTLKMIWSSRTRTRAARVWFESDRVAGFFF